MNNTFPYLESLKTKISLESLLRVQLWGPKHRTKVVDQYKLKRTDIVAFYDSFSFCYFFNFFFYFFVIKLFKIKIP